MKILLCSANQYLIYLDFLTCNIPVHTIYNPGPQYNTALRELFLQECGIIGPISDLSEFDGTLDCELKQPKLPEARSGILEKFLIELRLFEWNKHEIMKQFERKFLLFEKLK